MLHSEIERKPWNVVDGAKDPGPPASCISVSSMVRLSRWAATGANVVVKEAGDHSSEPAGSIYSMVNVLRDKGRALAKSTHSFLPRTVSSREVVNALTAAAMLRSPMYPSG